MTTPSQDNRPIPQDIDQHRDQDRSSPDALDLNEEADEGSMCNDRST